MTKPPCICSRKNRYKGASLFNVSLVSSPLEFLFLLFASPFAGNTVIISIQLSPIARFTPVYGCSTCSSGFSTVLVIHAGLRWGFLSRHLLNGSNSRRLLNWSLRCHASRPWSCGSRRRSIRLPRSYRRTGSWRRRRSSFRAFSLTRLG